MRSREKSKRVAAVLILVLVAVFAVIAIKQFFPDGMSQLAAMPEVQPQQSSDIETELSVQVALVDSPPVVMPTDLPIPTKTLVPLVPLPTVTPSSHATPFPALDGVEPLNCESDKAQGIERCSKYHTDDIEDIVVSLDSAMNIDVAVYVREDNTSPFLRWDIVYVGEDWIFIDDVNIIADGVMYDVPVDWHGDINPIVHNNGLVGEYFDGAVDSIEMLFDIAFAEEVVIQIAGTNGFFDKALTWREIQIVRRSLKTYQEMGGRFDAVAVDTADVDPHATPTPTQIRAGTTISPDEVDPQIETTERRP